MSEHDPAGCAFCLAGEPMAHNLEPMSAEDQRWGRWASEEDALNASIHQILEDALEAHLRIGSRGYAELFRRIKALAQAQPHEPWRPAEHE